MQPALAASISLPSTVTKRPLVAFRVGSELFALEAMDVRAAVRSLPVTPVPMAPAGLAGIAWYQEKALSVIDPRALLGMPPRHASVTPSVLMVKHEGELVALLVDKIEQVLTITSNDYAPTPVTIDSSWRAVTACVAHHEGGLVPVLDVHGLMRAIAH